MASYCETCKRDFDDKPTCGCKRITVDLTEAEARAIAQFFKRLLLDDYAAKCAPHETRPRAHEPAQQYVMQAAGEKIAAALAAQGFQPR